MPDQKQVLITDDVHPYLIEGLTPLYHIDYHPKMTYEQVLDRVEDYAGLVINSKIRVDDAFLDKAKQLEWVGRLGSGLDIIDLHSARRHQVTVINSPEGNANAVAEHALGMLLSLFNKIPLGDKMVRGLLPWERERARGRELNGMTVGVVGCGHTGSAFVKKLGGFELSVLIYDKYREHIPSMHRFQEETSLDQLLQQADVISFHLPLTPETSGWIDGDFMDRMKEGSVVINTSRGNIVNLKDLTGRLKNGHISGACLDVFENEKPSTYSKIERETMLELAGMEQVVLTPHVAGWTVESKLIIAQVLLKKILYVAGENE